MQESDAIIERIKQVNGEFQQLELAVEPELQRIKPGQTLLARRDERWEPYLREHWWPVDRREHRLVIERPVHEHYEIGQIVNVIGLVGKPFGFRRTLRNVLMIAYDTPPTAVLMIIPWMLRNRISATMVLMGTAREYDTQHLPPELEVIHAEDDLTWANQVMTVGWADQVFVTVAQQGETEHFREVVERFGELRADLPRDYLFGIFRPPLPCGTGACCACMLSLRKQTPLVCVEGPAFDLTQVELK
jgi:hypothetical protein